MLVLPADAKDSGFERARAGWGLVWSTGIRNWSACVVKASSIEERACIRQRALGCGHAVLVQGAKGGGIWSLLRWVAQGQMQAEAMAAVPDPQVRAALLAAAEAFGLEVLGRIEGEMPNSQASFPAEGSRSEAAHVAWEAMDSEPATERDPPTPLSPTQTFVATMDDWEVLHRLSVCLPGHRLDIGWDAHRMDTVFDMITRWAATSEGTRVSE